MSRLTIFHDTDSHHCLLESRDGDEIKQLLDTVGIRFERWASDRSLPHEASAEDILSAYHDEINGLVRERGYQSYDVIQLSADHADKEALRQKFLHEHTHSEDEVRFFVQGQGLFCLHMQGKVLQLLCQQDDLISVPAGTKHWFDMGQNPQFTCIRLFNNPDGWIAQVTGDEIASKFPLLDD